MNEITRISRILRHAFEKNAWHGPAIKEVLGDITEEQSQKKLNNSHSIIELVAHMTAWRTYTIRKLEGDESFDIENNESNFPHLKNWSVAQTALEESQIRLSSMLNDLPEEKLFEKVPGRKYDFYTLIHGMIHHDIYHLGQIQLIKKYA
jgi:uncharacterized damage-inducible protein DinB